MLANLLETTSGPIVDYGSLTDEEAAIEAAELERDFWASRENEPPYVPGSVVLEPEDYLPV